LHEPFPFLNKSPPGGCAVNFKKTTCPLLICSKSNVSEIEGYRRSEHGAIVCVAEVYHPDPVLDGHPSARKKFSFRQGPGDGFPVAYGDDGV
jgi:hypothetical protein